MALTKQAALKKRARVLAFAVKQARDADTMEKRAFWSTLIPLLMMGAKGIGRFGSRLIGPAATASVKTGVGKLGQWLASKFGKQILSKAVNPYMGAAATRAASSAGLGGKILSGLGGGVEKLGLGALWAPMFLPPQWLPESMGGYDPNEYQEGFPGPEDMQEFYQQHMPQAPQPSPWEQQRAAAKEQGLYLPPSMKGFDFSAKA